MNKSILTILIPVIFIAGNADATAVSDEDASKNAAIKSGSSLSLLSIDSKGFWLSDSGELVTPGIHIVKVGRFILATGKNIEYLVRCDTLAGHIYEANSANCVDLGVSKAASRQWEKEANERQQERLKTDALKYQEFKQALLIPQSVPYLKEMKIALESKQGGFKDDADNLLGKVNQQLQPYFEEERKSQEAEQKIVAAAAAEKAKQQAKIEFEAAIAEENQKRSDALRRKNELNRVAAFRKSLAEGDEANCGPIIEVKGKLVKVAVAVANYGNEHWIRRDEIFPSGYECRFVNGQYQTPL